MEEVVAVAGGCYTVGERTSDSIRKGRWCFSSGATSGHPVRRNRRQTLRGGMGSVAHTQRFYDSVGEGRGGGYEKRCGNHASRDVTHESAA